MHIEINDNTRLDEIQKVFSSFYPFLKIKFYRKRHKIYESSRKEDEVPDHTRIDDLKKNHVSGELEILPLYKVADVEKEFQKRFGLYVQILRKEKKGWEQTTGMDDFTLKEVNELGQNSSDNFIIEDYDESFDEPEDKPEKLL